MDRMQKSVECIPLAAPHLFWLVEVPLDVLRQRESKWLDMLNSWDKWMAKKHKKASQQQQSIRLRCQKGVPPSLRGRAWQQQDLFRVLKAYTLYRPEEGYCQAQAPIAAVLLMHMPAEEAIQLDGEILFSLLQRVSPLAYKHLSKQKIDPILYMTEWFMCAFSRTLPWSSVLRYTLGSSEKLRSCQGQYETMEQLRTLNPKIMQETFLVQEVIELPVTERHIEREHLIQLKKWKETHGELQCKSPPRFHGAKAIRDSEPYPHRALEPSPSIILPPGAALLPKGRKSKLRKGTPKGPVSVGDQANGPIPEENGSLLEPDSSLFHQSKESLSSRESEDTYL
ncbi:hypothetical protein E2320_012555 [Naja naja]|nr:hypothetical protein E2320_012555 [Naja naja]